MTAAIGEAPDRDGGAVTVEAAIAVGALVAVLSLVLAGVGAISGQLRCTDAAREAARLVARGEPERARHAVARIAPNGARLQVTTEGDEISVRVLADPVGGLLPGVRLRADAFAIAEPGSASAGAPAGSGESGGHDGG
ncbi:MAG: pilus assembly protein [Pseudonocardiaceae bacterium]|nr:pilus assembly protein [Pseudonocardiaceae bacterium]